MQEWRKQTDENMKIKEKQIEDLTNQVSSLQKERERLKSENQMLRRVDKDRRQVDPEDYRRLQSENQSLAEHLDQQIAERKREIEFWVSERATMREMIEQLENEKLN
jgi:N-methylhydantoinase B/oxoprolinase/acetone carboxylase alpha subunit